MRTVRWLGRLTLILATAAVAAVAAATLPDDPYQRFASLGNTIQARIRWIYERTHYDPKPIDIAVLGSSRWGAAVDSARLTADLAKLGRPLTTVNFSLPENGRDLHWVILQQLLAVRTPKLIVIGVIEKPGRLGHPAYKYVAPAADVVDPGYLGNLDYLSNLIYLPYRQLRLFAAGYFPAFFGLPARFDPALYPGSNNERNGFIYRDDGKAVDGRTRVDRQTLDEQARTYERGVHPPLLGRALAGVEFGNERAYVARMAEAARSRGIRVAFLFLPYYSGPSDIQERAFYERYGPIIDASFMASCDACYANVAHVNATGSAALTDWLAPRLAALVDGS